MIRAQTNSIFDIQIFFYFQTNSPNILLHIKVVKCYVTTFSQFMTPISLIVPIMKANYSENLMLNIDYYIILCTVCYPFNPKYPKILIVNSKRIII